MSDEDSESENEEEEVKPFVDTKCFRTSLEAQLLSRSPYLEEEWEAIISQALHASGSTIAPDIAMNEANA